MLLLFAQFCTTHRLSGIFILWKTSVSWKQYKEEPQNLYHHSITCHILKGYKNLIYPAHFIVSNQNVSNNDLKLSFCGQRLFFYGKYQPTRSNELNLYKSWFSTMIRGHSFSQRVISDWMEHSTLWNCIHTQCTYFQD